jgi:hypothetical protein
MSMTEEQGEQLAFDRVEEKIRAAVESAPPLPDDLSARLVELIRSADARRTSDARDAPVTHGSSDKERPPEPDGR